MNRSRITRTLMAATLVGAGLTATGVAASDQARAATATCAWFRVHDRAHVPSVSETGSVNCTTRRGNVSEAVRQLQDTLMDCYSSTLRSAGVYPLVRDGDFGGNTERGLKAVQRAAGTTADGVYGPNTRRAIKHPAARYGDGCIRVS